MGLMDKIKGTFVKSEEEASKEKQHRETLRKIAAEHKRKERIEYENAKHEARIEAMKKQGKIEGSKPEIKETIKKSLDIGQAVRTTIQHRKEEGEARRRGQLKALEYEAEHKARIQRQQYNKPAPKPVQREIQVPYFDPLGISTQNNPSENLSNFFIGNPIKPKKGKKRKAYNPWSMI